MGFWLTLFLWAVTFVLSELLRPKPKIENFRPANLGDFSFPTATQGRIVPLVWGTVKLEGPNVVWYGDLQQIAVTEKVKTGIFSSETITKGYEYHLGIQMALCRGPVDKLLKVWVEDDIIIQPNLTAEGTVVINEPEWFGGQDLGSGGIIGTGRWHVGNETQTASAYLSTFQQQGGDTPSYRGTSYFTLERVYIGTSTSVAPWRFEVQRIPNGLALGTPGVNGGLDANPMNVIYEVLTNDDWGLAFPATDIDVANFTTAATTLAAEGNGFSFVLDSPIEIADFLKELERQIDGVVTLDRTTGKWIVTLARGGYDINLMPLADESCVLEVDSYSRGAWDETQNEIRINFANRGNNYVTDFGAAQDGANIRVQNAVVQSQMNFPGVKVAALANDIAWRELRSLSRPLAKASLIVDRNFHAVNPGQVVAWSNTALGIVKLAMRVTKIDLGRLQQGQITLSVVEDVFNYKAGSYGAPPPTNWTPPSNAVVDIPVLDRSVFEAPKAFCDRDPFFPGVYRRVWFGARHQPDAAVLIELEVASTIVGKVGGFLLAGKLASQLNATDHGLTVDLVPDPDTQLAMLNTMFAANDDDIGVSLANICLIGSEFIAFKTGSITGANVRLNTVYRGLLDTHAQVHPVNTRVWLLYVRGNLTEDSFDSSPVSLKPIPISRRNRLASGSATASSITIANRHLKPYPVAKLRVNGGVYQASINIDDAVGAADDGRGMSTSWIRRDFRNTNEVKAAIDETILPADFPSANTTQHQLEVYELNPGASLLFTITYAAINDVRSSRAKILRYTNGNVPPNMRVIVKTQHTNSGLQSATQDVLHDFAITTALSANVNLSTLDDGEVSPQWVAPTTGTYSFVIGHSVFTGVAKLEARINGGGWVTVINTGGTSGNLPGVVAGDILEIRHTQNGADTDETLLIITSPSSGQKAHAVLVI